MPHIGNRRRSLVPIACLFALAPLLLVASSGVLALRDSVVASAGVAGDATRGTLLQPQLKAPWQGTATINQGNHSSFSHDVCYQREVDPDNCAWENTYALDVGLDCGAEVLAQAVGTVTYVDNDPDGMGGRELAVQYTGSTGSPFEIVYLHLSDVLVDVGSTVTQGQTMAKSGNSSFGDGGVSCHLHFHMWDGTDGRDAHTQAIERLVLKQVGVDSTFREYNAINDELDDAEVANRRFGSNNDMQKLVALGDPAPEELGGIFSEIDRNSFQLLDSGQATFRAKISGGSSSEGLFLWSDGEISKIVAAGDPTGTEIGGTFSSLEGPYGQTTAGWAVGDGQEWAFVAGISGGTSTKGIFLKSGDTFIKIAAQGDPAPLVGGTFSTGFWPPARNKVGQVAFRVDMTGGSASQGIFLWDAGTTTKAVAKGDPSPIPGFFGNKPFSSFGNPDIGEDGTVGFYASACELFFGCTLGFFKVKDGNATKVAAQGDPTPLGGTFSGFSGASGAPGYHAFSAAVSGGTAASGIFLWSDDSGIRKVAATGEETPIGGRYSSFENFAPPNPSRTGEVIIIAQLSGGPVPGAIFLDKGGCAVSLVREGDSTPIGGTFSKLGHSAINASDQFMFWSEVSGGSSSGGVFLAPALTDLVDVDSDQDGVANCRDACPDHAEDIDGFEDKDGCPDPGISNTDSDGDGLLDVWEESGIDVNGDGRLELDLKALGADRWRKDIFVEVDYMDCAAGGSGCVISHSHRPNDEAIAAVQEAFDSAPIAPPPEAPPGTRGGINLHVEINDRIPHSDKIGLEPAYCGGANFDDIKAAYFGTAAERSDPLRIVAKRLVFRYAVFGHKLAYYDAKKGTCTVPLGVGEVGGNDFIVATAGHLGPYRQHSGVFMHELGHTLGLYHGGSDWVNCKPNYLSIMTYSRANGWANKYWGGISSLLDYSDAELGPLREANLDERAGVGGASSDVVVYGVDGALAEAVPADGPIDWNGTGGEPEPSVSADINWITKVPGCNKQSPGEELRGYDDWANLKYSFRESGDFADLVHVTLPAESDPSHDDLLQARTDDPDFDGDTVATVEDNCPFAFNPSQEDSDGDALPGFSPDPSDFFGGDACDPDDDNDAFSDDKELYMGTDPLDACPDGPTDDAWPLDMNKDKFVTMAGDVWNFRDRIGARLGDPNWRQRLDLNMDNFITMAGDVYKFAGTIGKNCT